ncbi:unnamed protein product [Rhodiola kirilowii]
MSENSAIILAFYKTSTIILVHLIVCCALTSSVPNHPHVGGWHPIEDVNHPAIQDLVKFAIAAEKWSGGPRLQFERVIEGERQVVNGVNYRLILEASSDGKLGKYEAVLYVKVKPREHFRKLISFRNI